MQSSDDRDIFGQALDLAPTAVVIIDEAYTITFWNAEASRLFGCVMGEAKGLDFISRFISEDTRQEFKSFIRFHKERSDHKFKSSTNWSKLISTQGNIFQCQLSISQIEHDNSLFYAIYILPGENADQSIKKVVAENDFMRTIMDKVPVDIVIFDPDHRYLYLNKKAIKSDELREYIIGKDDFQYMAHTGRDESLARSRREWFNRAKETKTPQSYEENLIDKDGNAFTGLRNFYPILDDKGELKFMIGYGLDITERKKVEELKSNINQELETRVQERTRELKKANEDLDAFNTMVSHDLQSPIRTLSGFATLLKYNYHDKLDKEGLEFLELIDQGAKSMSVLIKGLLEFARLGKTNLTLTHTDMNDIVSGVVSEVRMSYPSTQTKVTIKSLPEADCDATLMRQVWLNLIGNAFKYSSKKERPKIEIGYQTNDGKGCYYIRDNGAGFDEEYGEKLFKMFQRLHSGFEYEGTGVGLAIVKRIIEKHGGSIWAESLLGEGATFYFTIGE